MGKRSDFERKPRDFYRTPLEAVIPLIPYLEHLGFIEPCAGDGALITALEGHGLRCQDAFDIEPKGLGIRQEDVLLHSVRQYQYITNPPWDRKILHPMIENLVQGSVDLWLLFDADWAHTKQAVPYLRCCSKIVSVGRVCWFPGTKMTGKDNCCWYQFNKTGGNPVFIPRIL